jgi:signal transduction histidine kinase
MARREFTFVRLTRAAAWRLKALTYLVITLALCVGCLAGRAEERLQRVLLLYPADNTQPATTRAGVAIGRRLRDRSPAKIEVYADFLDLIRFPTETDQLRTGHFLAEKYAHISIDILMPVGAAALRFALKYRRILAPDAPIVFCCSPPAAIADLPNDVTGVYSEVDFAKTMMLAQRLQPEARDLVVISGSSEFERQALEPVRKQLEPYERRFNAKYWLGLPYETLLDRVSHLPRETIVIFTTVVDDGSSRTLVPAQVVEGLAKVASAPIYGSADAYLGLGIVGGYIDLREDSGIAAADLALEILAGKDPRAITPRPSNALTFRVDARQLRRWQLSGMRLPAGTITYFKEPTAWEQYRWQIMLIAAALLIQTTLIVGLFYQFRRRRKAEAVSRSAMGKLAHMNRVATAGEMTASIAHEVSQPLAAMAANASAGLAWLLNKAPDLDQVRAALESVVSDAHRAADLIGSVRAMFKRDGQEKTPVNLNDVIRNVLGLVRGELRAEGIVVQTGLSTSLPLVRGDSGQLQQVILNLIRNAADAMNSVSDRPRVLTVKTAIHDPDGVLVSVEDSGRGIDPKDIDRIFDSFFTTKSQGMGMGLSICRSIIEAHGGRLWASSRINNGSVFSIQLPAVRGGLQETFTIDGPTSPMSLRVKPGNPRDE